MKSLHLKPLQPDLSPQKPSILLFDWDGTLVDSFSVVFGGYQAMSAHFKMPAFSEDDVRKNMRRSSRDLFPLLFGDRAEEAREVFYTYVGQHKIEPYAGTEDMLKRFQSMGLLMGVVSNKNHQGLLNDIQNLGWQDLLPVAVGAGQAARDKPEPDPLLLAAEGFPSEVSKTNIWYIGDSETDMIAAIKADMEPIFIGHGLRTMEDCAESNVFPYFCNNINVLIRLVEKTIAE